MIRSAVTSVADAARDGWDVVIIGAGPAGSLAAYELARQQLRVLVVERKTFPRYKVCGACLSATAAAQLRASGLEYLINRATATALQSFSVGSRWGRCTLPIATGYSMAREDLDTGLLRAAESAGATLLAPAAARLLPIAQPGPWRTVEVQSGEQSASVSARVVIVASGLGSLSRVMGAEIPERVSESSRLGIGAVLQPANDAYVGGTIWMAVGSHGYAGLVRLPDGSLNVAAALDRSSLRHGSGPLKAIQRLLEQCGLPALSGGERAEWQGTPLLTRMPRRVWSWRVLLIGDASGYVEPFTGEGMAWAMEAARAVAAVAPCGVRSWSLEVESQWHRWHVQSLHRRQQRCRRLTRWLRYPWAVRGGVITARCFPSLAATLAWQLTRTRKEYMICN